MKYLFLDTETGGLDNTQADVLQLAWTVTDKNFEILRKYSFFMERTLPITERALEVNGLDDAFLKEYAAEPEQVYGTFLQDLMDADILVAHYAPFDKGFIIEDAARRLGDRGRETAFAIRERLESITTRDTKLDYIWLCSSWRERRHPGPYLDEMCQFLGVFTKKLRFHRADSDVEAMRLCMQAIKYQYSDTIPG